MTAGPLGVLAVILLALAGCSSPPSASPSSSAPTPAATETPMARPTPTVAVPITAATPTPVREPVAPERVVVESLGIDVPVVPVGVEKAGFMELPIDPAVAGWYRFGSDPAAAAGNTVISAHVDAPQYPIGPFSRLRDVGTGQTVEVTDAGGRTHRYSVQSVTYYPKAELPAGELFDRTGAPGLILITCGGAFDSSSGRYADNVVVVATPTS